MLPLNRGEHVLLPTEENALANALATAGLEVTLTTGLPWLMAPNTVDHVLLPAPGDAVANQIIEANRVLRPGGHLLLGFMNGLSLYRWSTPERSAGYLSLTFRQARHLLQRHRFRLEASYGVRESLGEPVLCVPLDTPDPTVFYFRYRFVPYTWSGSLLGWLAPCLATLGAHTLLYPAVFYVARSMP